MRRVRCGVAGLLMLGAVAARVAEGGARPADAMAKIHPRVLAEAARDPSGEIDCVILLHEQADLSGAARLPSKLERGRFVMDELMKAAARTQPAVISSIAGKDAYFQPFWVVNAIHFRGPFRDALTLAERNDVWSIEPNPPVRFAGPVSGTDPRRRVETIEPGVAQVGAPAVWSRGFTGQGIVVGGMDTGYRWTHAALKSQYRGWNGASENHNFNWHDAIHSGGGVCGANAAQPCDDDGHGTHTMGTMVGTDGASRQIGVAPGARWIGCRCMDRGLGTPATYLECMQWFISPTDSTGANADPAMAPDVVNNSWGCPPEEGCAPTTLQIAIENVRAAGIVVVSAAGNEGPFCNTIMDPPAIYDATITVAAVDSTNTAASFSSRGTVTSDGSNRLKPDVSAPGVSVRSAYRTSNTSYATLSGTSMATPHTVGVVALVLSAHPGLIGNPGAVQNLLQQSAARLTSTQACGGVPGTQIPNTIYGWGLVQAQAAVGLDDTDGDGLADWQEYLTRTDPMRATSTLQITSVARAANECRLTFSSVAGVQYRLESSDRIDAPTWVTVVDNVAGTGSPVLIIDPNVPADVNRFYRVVVVP